MFEVEIARDAFDWIVAVAQVVAALAAAWAAWAAWAAVRAIRQEHEQDREQRWHDDRRRRFDEIRLVLAELQSRSYLNHTHQFEANALKTRLRFLLDSLDPAEADQLGPAADLAAMDIINPEAVQAAIDSLAAHEAKQREI